MGSLVWPCRNEVEDLSSGFLWGGFGSEDYPGFAGFGVDYGLAYVSPESCA